MASRRFPGAAGHPVFVVVGGVVAVAHAARRAFRTCRTLQVIVYTEYPGQAPQVVEDQVLSADHRDAGGAEIEGGARLLVLRRLVRLRDLRGRHRHLLGRSRVLEYLNFRRQPAAAGVAPALGPDATGVGWVYQYALLARPRRWPNCARSRTGICATS